MKNGLEFHTPKTLTEYIAARKVVLHYRHYACRDGHASLLLTRVQKAVKRAEGDYRHMIRPRPHCPPHKGLARLFAAAHNNIMQVQSSRQTDPAASDRIIAELDQSIQATSPALLQKWGVRIAQTEARYRATLQ